MPREKEPTRVSTLIPRRPGPAAASTTREWPPETPNSSDPSPAGPASAYPDVTASHGSVASNDHTLRRTNGTPGPDIHIPLNLKANPRGETAPAACRKPRLPTTRHPRIANHPATPKRAKRATTTIANPSAGPARRGGPPSRGVDRSCWGSGRGSGWTSGAVSSPSPERLRLGISSVPNHSVAQP